MESLPKEDAALVQLGRALREQRYQFITPTPETHRRVNARKGNESARSVRDVFGWSRPFDRALLPGEWIDWLETASAVEPAGEGLLRSRVRVSSLEDQLFFHSAYPTVEADAVFFGPDTYRFASFLATEPGGLGRVVDVGCGSGAGGLCVAARSSSVSLGDINHRALRFARINAVLNAAQHVEVVESDVLRAIDGRIDTVVANPPYLVDDGRRAYREGGGPLGIELSVRIVQESLTRLSERGRLLLYTATPIFDGEDPLRAALVPLLEGRGFEWSYRELDPDVFGEELENPAYARADRLAVIGLNARRVC